MKILLPFRFLITINFHFLFTAALFLELWKRYSAKITHRWDLTGFDIREEHPRPQYLARLAHVKKIRIDYITNTKEPDPPFWRMKLPAAVFSFSIVLLLVALAFAAVLAVVLYRMSVLAALSVSTDEFTTTNAIYITTITAALINLLLIFLFSWVRQKYHCPHSFSIEPISMTSNRLNTQNYYES